MGHQRPPRDRAFRTVRTQVSLREDLYRAARREAKRRGITLAELCRRALADMVRSSDREPWLRYLGCLDSGDRRASRTVDRVVYGRNRP